MTAFSGVPAMELKWLDDYVALVETGSFSAAARRRHVSQPAFSRRIRMLEDWLGVTLVDRSRKPLQFTAVARDNQLAFRNMVARIYEFRAMLKSAAMDSGGVTIAAQHTLAAAYMPDFLARLRQLDPHQSFRIRSENRAESIALMMRGEAEVLLTYDSPQVPCHVPEQVARRHVIGQDHLVLVAAPALHSRVADIAEGDPLPMLCFPPESFFGQLLRAEALPALMRRQQVLVRCVSEFAMGLRELALGGEGLVWLPTSLIRHDLDSGALLPLDRLGSPVPMEIVVFIAVLDGGRGETLRKSFLRQQAEATTAASAAVPAS